MLAEFPASSDQQLRGPYHKVAPTPPPPASSRSEPCSPAVPAALSDTAPVTPCDGSANDGGGTRGFDVAHLVADRNRAVSWGRPFELITDAQNLTPLSASSFNAFSLLPRSSPIACNTCGALVN